MTVMPRAPRSRARPWLRPISADLLAAYSATPGRPARMARQLPMLMMRPPSGMDACAVRMATKGARTLMFIVRS
ncbi:hypothetical protein D3C71_1927130 [compost metagenome]